MHVHKSIYTHLHAVPPQSVQNTACLALKNIQEKSGTFLIAANRTSKNSVYFGSIAKVFIPAWFTIPW